MRLPCIRVTPILFLPVALPEEFLKPRTVVSVGFLFSTINFTYRSDASYSTRSIPTLCMQARATRIFPAIHLSVTAFTKAPMAEIRGRILAWPRSVLFLKLLSTLPTRILFTQQPWECLLCTIPTEDFTKLQM